MEEENNAKGVTPTINVEVWYEKVSEWIDFVNQQAQDIVNELSNLLSINEMIKLFKGCHSQTHIVMDIVKSLLGMYEQEKTKEKNFVFVMNNYFPLPKVVDEMGLQYLMCWGCPGKERLATQVDC